MRTASYVPDCGDANLYCDSSEYDSCIRALGLCSKHLDSNISSWRWALTCIESLYPNFDYATDKRTLCGAYLSLAFHT